MIEFFKVYIASLLLIYLTLFSWINGYHMGCYMLIFPLLMLLVISYSFIDLKMQERLCFKNCFFKEGSLFAKMLSSKILVTIFYILLSLVMSISALMVALDFQTELWIYILTFNILLIILLYRWFNSLLRNTINDSYRKLIAREWSGNIATLLLLIITIYIYYNGYEPLYLEHTLEASMVNASNSIASQCAILESILKLQKESDALFWWVIVNGSQHIQYHLLKIAIWILFLLLNSMALLGINRFIVQIVYIVERIFVKPTTPVRHHNPLTTKAPQ